MLKFYDYSLTNSLEVPDEICLNFHLAECQNRCKGCFSPELWDSTDINLTDVYKNLVLAYYYRITCVCFLGEGKNTSEEHTEFKKICEYIHNNGIKTCLYSGRNCGIEDWMKCFDYVKVGSYIEKYGDLSSPSTNQRLMKKTDKGYEDITHLFWN